MRRCLALFPLLAWTACSDTELVPTTFGFEVPASLDFGEAPIGLSKRIDLPIKNTSTLAIEIESIKPGPGFTGSTHLFRIEGEVSSIAPSDTALVAVLFVAYDDMTEPVVSSLSVVTDFETKEVKLSGSGVPALRVEPSTLEFGRVALETTKSLEVTITNLLDIPLDLIAGPLDHLGAEEISFAAAELTGPLPARGTTTLRVDYTPMVRTSLEDRARLPFSYCNDRTLCETVVDLRGRVEEELTCDPIAIDFGPVIAGSTIVREAVCTVVASRDITVLEVESPSSELQVTTDLRLPAQVRPGQQIRLALAYRPVSFSLRGTVTVEASISETATLIPPAIVDVTGELAEPRLEVRPLNLEFGAVSLGTYYSRDVFITNTGANELALTLTASDPMNVFMVTPSSLALVSGETKRAVVTYFPVNPEISTGELVLDSTDAGEARVALSGSGIQVAPCEYRLQPESLDFGVVEVGWGSTLPLRIENVGADDCLFRGFTASGPPFALERTLDTELLRPGEAKRLLFSYTPDARDTDSGSFTFYVSDPRNSQPRIGLGGRGEHDVPIIYPDLLDFGPLEPACTGDRTIRIHNGRQTTLRISEIALDPSHSPGMFLENVPQLPLSLEYGQSAELSVRYVGVGLAEASAIVRVREDGFSFYSVGVLGTPVADENAAVMEERFVQHGDTATDVLFVIDTSYSGMVRAEMATAFPSFIAPADSENIDYQLAFIDHTYGIEPPFECVRRETLPAGYQNGRCGYFFEPASISDWKFISRDEQPSPGEVFAAAMEIGETFGSAEWLFENARSALRAPLTLGWNAGLPRKDADLALIMISDEDEQSIGSVDMFVDALLRIKGAAHKNRASVHGLVALDTDGCQGPFGSAVGGARVREASRKTGGAVEDFCSATMEDPMTAFGSRAFASRGTFLLETRADPATVEVIVDGVPLPAGEVSTGLNWTYDDEIRGVKFEPASAPERGAEIAIRYRPACL